MNSSHEESRQRALDLLELLVSNYEPNNEDNVFPFFEFPDGPKEYKFVRGWVYPVPSWFHSRLGFQVRYSNKSEDKFLKLSDEARQGYSRVFTEQGEVRYEKEYQLQTSAFSFKKGDVIQFSPAAFTLVDKEGNKNPLSIEGWPEKSNGYIQVKEGTPAKAGRPEIIDNKGEIVRSAVPRNMGRVKFLIHHMEGIEELEEMTQDDFVRFLIGDLNS